MKIKMMFILFVFFFSKAIFAQDDYQKWLEKENKKLESFISEEDKKFVDFLKKEWIKTDLQESPRQITKPKPIKPVTLKPDLPIENQVIKTIALDTEKKIIKKEPEQKTEEIRQAPIPNKSNNSLQKDIGFLGKKISIFYNPELAVTINKPLSNKSIADVWEKLSKGDYKNFLQQIASLSNQLKLNDWGKTKLIYSFASEIVTERNSAYLITWFVLNKLGYKSRVAFRADEIYLLVSSKEALYSVPFFNIGSEKLFLINFDGKKFNELKSVSVYKDDFPGSVNQLSFSIESVPSFANQYDFRDLEINYKGTVYKFTLTFNRAATDFYASYPQTSLSIYPKVQITVEAEEVILRQLRIAIDGRNTADALNFLLHFVQQATSYKTDDEQFGFEKPMFPEESLFYKFSDCEDRSILFSYLVQKMLGLNVILLDFPDHIATAVAINGVEGDYITHNNRKYLICDPTYLGADIGECMPDYKKVNPELVIN